MESYNEITETVEERTRRLNLEKIEFNKICVCCETDKFKETKNESLDIPKVPTGYKPLDKEFGGGLPITSITCISGAPSVGKSTFALQMAEQIAKSGVDVIYFNYEMNRTQVASKSIARNCFIRLNKNQDDAIPNFYFTTKLKWNDINDDMWNLSKQVADDLHETNSHLFFIDCISKQYNANQIYDTIERWKEAFKKIPVIFIDYLHMIAPPMDESGKPTLFTDKQILDYNMRTMRKIANDFYCPVVFISALKKDDFKSLADMGSLSGSSGIPYNCDIIISLQYGKLDDKDGKEKFDLEFEQKLSPRRIMAVVTKDRYCMVGGKIKFDYYSKFDYFDDSANGSQGYRCKDTKEDITNNENKNETKDTKKKTIINKKNEVKKIDSGELDDIF